MSLFSPTEEFGLALLNDSHMNVLSVGISTAGSAEIRMARAQPNRHITATTIDEAGSRQTLDLIDDAGLAKQITVKIEDIASDTLPYADGEFDFVYARLVLHYLSRQQLEKAIKNVSRLICMSGMFYVVVRSDDCAEARNPNSQYDPVTGLTTYQSISRPDVTAQRFFHSDTSMSDVLGRNGFEIQSLKHVKEALAFGFERDELATHQDDLIRVVALKK